ncbi:ABC transporter family substrate-binding protein [Streptomyces sp. PSKA54]|uniref:ABC transporter family substrate-binding protein n=1 Tax=Streptomyces himalayensis subsp. aureolus TaxID=2758039 RepID=A0A7W2D7T3_9ACTN|nr:ABC transporter family substrate-binding protein [Streptomyces himalayensis]MBA4866346.1 ABC transporter family substrate-binding protein [Streptomyces himalayensis subsp. aureolus]
MSLDGVRLRPVMRCVAFLAAGVLAVPALAGCSSGSEKAGRPVAGQDIAPAGRELISDGGTLNWAVDALPETLNAFQADADATTSRITGAVLPSLFRLDELGRPQRNPAFLESAEIVEREPKQVVLYKINQQAVWSDGREIGAADFTAQWRALSGKDTAYWTARNAGYDRIEKIERGASDLEVRVTFAKPYADWRSLFSPLYPKDVMGTPDTFNDGARSRLKATAGPFTLTKIDRAAGDVTLERNPRWWGNPAKLSTIVLRAVPRDERAAALAEGRLDLADVEPADAQRIALATRDKGADGAPVHGPAAETSPAQALRSWAVANGSDAQAAQAEKLAREKRSEAAEQYTKEQASLRDYVLRKSLEPAYTQLALNGSQGPLADERVRRAVARALDREELARLVLTPLGLPAEPVGNHLALAGQAAYADNSGALGGQDTEAAQALLADAGWVPGGTTKDENAAGSEARDSGKSADGAPGGSSGGSGSSSDSGDSVDSGTYDEAGAAEEAAEDDDGTYIVGQEDDKPGTSGSSVLAPAPAVALQSAALVRQADALVMPGEADREKLQDPRGQEGRQQARRGGVPGAYAPKGTAAPKTSGTPQNTASPAGAAADGAAAGQLAKDGKPLTLRFVLPSGPGSEQLRAVGDRITRMLERIGIRTETSKVSDDSYFKDHIASGQYDLALYSWPATAFPATDNRPIFAKPVAAADGSLSIEQNYTRVGTDHIDQLFDQAIAELDKKEAASLVKQADARIWAVAGSIPLYQRPQLVAARPNLANAGAFGFETPVYEDMGYLKSGVHQGAPKGSPSH